MNDLFCNLLLGEIFIKVKLLLKEKLEKETARYCFQMNTQKPCQNSEPGADQMVRPIFSLASFAGRGEHLRGFLRCGDTCIIDKTQMKTENLKLGHFQDLGNFHIVYSMFGNFLRPIFNVKK